MTGDSSKNKYAHLRAMLAEDFQPLNAYREPLHTLQVMVASMRSYFGYGLFVSFFLLSFFFPKLGSELRVSPMVDKGSTTELDSQFSLKTVGENVPASVMEDYEL